MKRIVIALLALLVLAGLGLYAVGRGAFGSHEEPGEVTAVERPAVWSKRRRRACALPPR